MGFALAEEAARLGAKVVLVSGPTALSPKNSQIELIVLFRPSKCILQFFKYYHKVDIAIAAAAVADFSPANPAQQKIKKKWVFQ